MAITIDTHALIWYILDELNDKLSKKAEAAIDTAVNESIIYVPSIVLIEILHIIEKGRIDLDFQRLLEMVKESSNFDVTPMDMDVVTKAKDIKGLNIHDRIIYASAFVKDTPIVSKDLEIRNQGENVIW